MRKNRIHKSSMMLMGCGDSGGGNPPPAVFGLVYSNNMQSLSDWTVVSPHSTSVASGSGTLYTMTTGNAVFWPYTDYMYNTGYGLMATQNFRCEVDFVPSAIITNGGITIGTVKGYSGRLNGVSWGVGYDGSQMTSYVQGATYNSLIYGSVTCNMGTSHMTLSCQLVNGVFTFTIKNNDDNTTYSGSYTIVSASTAGNASYPPLYCYPGIINQGSTINMTAFRFYNLDYQYADDMFMGDSITW